MTIVFSKPLHQHSHPSSAVSSLPSNLHAGSCNADNPIAANLSAAFLDFSAKHLSLDLRKSGIKENDRYCIDIKTWQNVVAGGDDAAIPRVKLENTHEAALKSVGLDELKKWKAEQDNERGVEWTKDKRSGVVKESQEIGGKEPRA